MKPFHLYLLAIALGGLLVWLAVPRTIAAFASLPGNPVAESLQYGEPVPADELDTLRAGRRLARQFIDSGRLDTDVALADLAELATANADAPTQARLLSESVVLLRRGLSLAPANGFAWARLAYALSLGGQPDGAAQAWRMSILTVPVDRRLALWRVALGLELAPVLTAEDEPLLDRQIRWAWLYSRNALAKLALERKAVAAIRAALAADSDQAGQFDSLVGHDGLR